MTSSSWSYCSLLNTGIVVPLTVLVSALVLATTTRAVDFRTSHSAMSRSADAELDLAPVGNTKCDVYGIYTVTN